MNRLIEYMEQAVDESGNYRLSGGYVSRLAVAMDVSESTIRNHLSLLTRLDLIRKEKRRERGTVGPVTFFIFTLPHPGARVERVKSGFYEIVMPK